MDQTHLHHLRCILHGINIFSPTAFSLGGQAFSGQTLAGALPGTLRGVLLDVAYEPRPTALGAAWAAAGGTVVGGERMLLHQAAEQVRLMTGLPAPLEEMAGALDAALAAR